jgi:hypothetical protein
MKLLMKWVLKRTILGLSRYCHCCYKIFRGQNAVQIVKREETVEEGSARRLNC